MKDIDSIDFRESFDHARVYLPVSLTGVQGFNDSLANLTDFLAAVRGGGKAQTVALFLQGSKNSQYDQRLAGWIVNRFNIILIAPATHKLTGRPVYVSPASNEIYRQVHQFRKMELDYMVNRLDELMGLDRSRLVLIGHSEGAVAAGTWQGEAAVRILLAWSCEHNYFSREHILAGDRKTTRILNIIGSRDEFFAQEESLSSGDDIQGHGAKQLAEFARSKVVIYPGEGHRVFDNSSIGYDIQAFMEQWKDEEGQQH